MKKRFEDFTIEDLTKLRGDIVLNSIYTSDYNNSFGIKAHCMCAFFDGYLSYIEEIANEDGFTNWGSSEFYDKYDTPNNLYSWYYCFDDFDWVEYEEDEEVEEPIRTWCGLPIY